jgi:hypothetical protein
VSWRSFGTVDHTLESLMQLMGSGALVSEFRRATC